MTAIDERAAGERVARELGPTYGIVRLSGRWVIGDERVAAAAGGGFGRVSPEPLRASLDKAIADVKAIGFPRSDSHSALCLGEAFTLCCGAAATFHDTTLCCKSCWKEVGFEV